MLGSIISVSKVFHFDAAHYLPGHVKCGEMHGHTWKVIVTLKGMMANRSAMLIDFHILNSVVKPILEEWDHKCLNKVLANQYPHWETDSLFPTVEMLAIILNHQIRTSLQSKGLDKTITTMSILVQEGEGGFAEHTLDFNSYLSDYSSLPPEAKI